MTTKAIQGVLESQFWVEAGLAVLFVMWFVIEPRLPEDIRRFWRVTRLFGHIMRFLLLMMLLLLVLIRLENGWS